MSTFQYYTVAGHCFAVMPREGKLTDNYAPFAVAEGTPLFVLEEVDRLPEVTLTPVDIPTDLAPDEPFITLHTACWGAGCSGLCFTMAPITSHPMVVRLLVDHTGGRAWMNCVDRQFRTFAVNNSLMLLYALFTANRNTLLMHASTVAMGGYGYLFLGVSGTGKSTHSRLWMESLDGVTLLNDDNPVVRIGDDGVARVHGTPWSGKTPCYINRSVPVGGIVDLEQAPQNAIRRLTLPEAYAAVISSTSGLKYDSTIADGLHNTLSALLTRVACWHLRCLPNHDAAQLCHTNIAVAAPLSEGFIELPNALLLKEVDSLLKEGKQVTLLTKGYSMLPFIRGGRDSVRLKRHDSYSVGDVVLAEVAPSHYVLHRIAAINGHRVTLAGDGNLGQQEYCAMAHIAGRAEALVAPSGRERPVKRARVWLRLPRIAQRATLILLRKVFIK